MKLFLLQLREEFRRLRPILPVWLLCVILMAVWAVLHVTRPASASSGFDPFGATPLAVVLLIVVPGAILAKTIGMADPALAPSAAWAARPLRGGVLASAKLATIVLAVLLPPAVAESLVIGILFGPETLPAVWGYYLVVGFAGGVVLVAMSALAGSWDRFAWLAMGGVVLTVLIAAIADQYGVNRRLEPSLIASRIVTLSLLALAGGAAVLFDVYLRRRPREALLLTLVVFFACQAGLYAWPFDFYQRAPERTATTEAIRITSTEARITRVPGADDVMQDKLRVSVQVENLPRDWRAAGRTLRWAGGERRWFYHPADPDAAHVRASAVATDTDGGGPGAREMQLEFNERITPEMAKAFEKAGGRLLMEFKIDLYRLTRMGELPFGDTGTAVSGQVRVRKLQPSWRPGYVQTSVLYAIHQPLLDIRGPLVRSSQTQFSIPIALVDDLGPRLAERGPSLAETGQNERNLMPFAISRRSLQAAFPLRRDESNGVDVLSRLEDDAVVFMYSRYEGTVVHEVSVQVNDAADLSRKDGDG